MQGGEGSVALAAGHSHSSLYLHMAQMAHVMSASCSYCEYLQICRRILWKEQTAKIDSIKLKEIFWNILLCCAVGLSVRGRCAVHVEHKGRSDTVRTKEDVDTPGWQNNVGFIYDTGIFLCWAALTKKPTCFPPKKIILLKAFNLLFFCNRIFRLLWCTLELTTELSCEGVQGNNDRLKYESVCGRKKQQTLKQYGIRTQRQSGFLHVC